MARRRLRDLTDDEARAEAALLKDRRERADREAAPLWLLQSVERHLEAEGVVSWERGDEVLELRVEEGSIYALVQRHEDPVGPVESFLDLLDRLRSTISLGAASIATSVRAPLTSAEIGFAEDGDELPTECLRLDESGLVDPAIFRATDISPAQRYGVCVLSPVGEPDAVTVLLPIIGDSTTDSEFDFARFVTRGVLTVTLYLPALEGEYLVGLILCSDRGFARQVSGLTRSDGQHLDWRRLVPIMEQAASAGIRPDDRLVVRTAHVRIQRG